MAYPKIDAPGRDDFPQALFARWRLMISKCYSASKSPYRKNGIKVCDEWIGRDGFKNFVEWSVSHGFSPDLVIDRIDTYGNYCPENCRWVTTKENNRNRRDTVFIQTDNGKMPLVEFCEKRYGDKIPSHTSRYRRLYQRIKAGKPYADILSADQTEETDSVGENMSLKNVPTCELVEELETREGVETNKIGPTASITVKADGPAVVLLVID